MKLEDQRKHLHDMANSLSIVEASVSRVLTLLGRDHPELVDEINRLKKADEYSKKTINSLKALRELSHDQV